MPQDHRSESSILDELRQRQCAAWERGERPLLEGLIADVVTRLSDDELLELILAEVMLRKERREECSIDEYQRRFPHLAKPLSRLFEMQGAFDGPESFMARSVPEDSLLNVDSSIAVVPRSDASDETLPPESSVTPTEDLLPSAPDICRQIGRYRVEGILGKGGFGSVYLAHDEQLSRKVAIKVPHRHLISRPGDAESYLSEARTVANLDHPHIVPVHDVGSTAEFPFFVVSKYIEGSDLASKLKQARLSQRQAAELVANVADALHCAHKQGLVHRDVKPGNILIDNQGKAFVVDFGLALREGNVSEKTRYAGTPAYMSPEQARGEGHRIDGRSDIFSLGAVLYELLAGRRPFRASSELEVMKQVVNNDPRPPRQYDETIAAELERICLKALSKRASDRYTTAFDLAEDLRHYLHTTTLEAEHFTFKSFPLVGGHVVGSQSVHATSLLTDVVPAIPLSNPRPIKIVPKGLRSFDAHDADFFLELLPGARDRDGLPDSIRFWKVRLEATDPDNTFSVGLIYGPSGCGKSSLVKAGLLPRLSNQVIVVNVEATAEETESRLLHSLRKRCPALAEKLSLKETLAALRRGQGLPIGQKVVIVLDQFEQWLHSKKDQENTELVQALRQCDGGRLQCVVMVRDDFWMAATRFMRELEVRLVEAQNSAAVDLFPIRHAEKVLTAFGRAFGTLPDATAEITSDQKRFLDQAVSGLAQEGKVISVRLALFAEMMKGKHWTPSSLNDVGGTEGVGSTFLEETFSAATAPPEHRYHQKAARAVLKLLLPELGTDIKGHMRSSADLLQASGYGNRPNEFEDLIRILDSEMRLITPTDPEGQEEGARKLPIAKDKYYQLTHDYLVPSLRDWLTRKQKETRRGRAALLLEERSVVWNACPENRQLPSLIQWIQITLYTDKNKWTLPQQKMMSLASRNQVLRGSLFAFLLTFAVCAGFAIRQQIVYQQNAAHAEDLTVALLKADIAETQNLILDLYKLRQSSLPLLKAKLEQLPTNSTKKLHVAMALLPVDSQQADYVADQLLTCTIEQFPFVRKALIPFSSRVSDHFWTIAQDELQPAPRRFHAAAALAEYCPNDDRWQMLAPFVSNHLTTSISPVFWDQWRLYLEAVRGPMTSSLLAIHTNRSNPDKQRAAAAYVVSDFLRDQPKVLVSVILLADELAEFTELIEALKPHAEAIKQDLIGEMNSPMPAALNRINDEISEADQELRNAHWKRQALAAVSLVNLGFGDNAWHVLKMSSYPSLRSFVIHYLAKLGTNHEILANQLRRENDVSIRRALIQSLGGLNPERIPPADRNRLSEHLKSLFLDDPDPAIHSSAAWSLRRFGGTLPKLQVGVPALTEDQNAKLALLTKEVDEVRDRMIILEKESPQRQKEWERQLRRQQTTSTPSLSRGLVSHYPMDELSGTETANAIAGQPKGVYGGPGEPEWEPGVIGQAVRFDGLGGHFSCGTEFDPERSDEFSYGCWFFSEDARQWAGLIAKTDDEHRYRGFDLWLEQGLLGAHLVHQEIFSEEQDHRFRIMSTVPTTVRRWHHAMMTYDGSSTPNGISLYIDGQIVATFFKRNSRLSETIRNKVPLHIGARNTTFPFRGSIDDVRIYDRRLTDQEVQKLFEAGVQSLVSLPLESITLPQREFLTEAFRKYDETLHELKSQQNASETAWLDVRWRNVRRWYVNSLGQTMVVMKGPDQLGNNFKEGFLAVAVHETTLEEFRRFRPEHRVNASFAPTGDCPVHNVSWYLAAEYCNWVSEQEGISKDQWIYEPNAENEFAEGMKIKTDASRLTGYRLPTEREWESACSAGTIGTFCFGELHVLIDQYGWEAVGSKGRSHPVESLLPNEVGLFDMHGNVWNWTQTPGSGPLSPVSASTHSVMHGGSFWDRSAFVRSNFRFPVVPTTSNESTGVRLVRTFPLE